MVLYEKNEAPNLGKDRLGRVMTKIRSKNCRENNSLWFRTLIPKDRI